VQQLLCLVVLQVFDRFLVVLERFEKTSLFFIIRAHVIGIVSDPFVVYESVPKVGHHPNPGKVYTWDGPDSEQTE
jgi:hypothetical protein